MFPILLLQLFLTTCPTFPETHIFECTQNGVVPYTVKNPKSQCRRSGVFIVDFEYIQHLALVFLLLTLTRNRGWERTCQFFLCCLLSLSYVTESFLKIILLCKLSPFW